MKFFPEEILQQIFFSVYYGSLMHCECRFMCKKSEVNLPLTGSVIKALHVVGRKFPLAEGNTLMSCSKGLNCRWIMMTLCKSRVNTSGAQGQNKITHNRVCVNMQCVSNYRFGPFLEIAEHALDVFEVGGKRSIMKGKIPLPGCATLWQNKQTKNRHSETVCHTTHLQLLQSEMLDFERPSTQVIFKTSSISPFNGRPWYTIKFAAQLTPQRAYLGQTV